MPSQRLGIDLITTVVSGFWAFDNGGMDRHDLAPWPLKISCRRLISVRIFDWWTLPGDTGF